MGKGKKGAADEGASKKSSGKQSIKIRHILCEKQSKALEAIAGLQTGEPFDVVARKLSKDKARSGGDLGWKKKEELVPAFSSLAFDLAISTTKNPAFNAEPLKTEFGYHVIMVEGAK